MPLKTIKEADEFYADIITDAEKHNVVWKTMRELVKNDLYFLLLHILNRQDLHHQWLYERCREVEADPNGRLDLWAREHRKSTIITFGLTIQDILWDPEVTIGIFSITRPKAKAFLKQIKNELQGNTELKWLFPDVLYQDPENEAEKWSEEGITVKRKSNPKECTLEAYGFVQGLPTGSHFRIRLYDDAIDEKNVTNSDIIAKAISEWELSLNLGSDVIVPRYGEADIERYIGTRYHYNDIYHTIIERKAAKVRKHACTDNGKPSGKSVYFPEKLLREKLAKMGSYTAGCQMFLDPKADVVMGFDIDDLRHWETERVKASTMNIYLLVDPASKKNPTSDFTTIEVIGLGEDGNTYLLDAVRARLSLKERAATVIKFHRLWPPIKTGYEEYGMQADIEYIKEKMDEENYRFEITPIGGNLAKETRIGWLAPMIEEHKYYIPIKLAYIDHEGKSQNFTAIHEQELRDFPFGMYDDTIDCSSRIKDPKFGAVFPEKKEVHDLLADNKRSRTAQGMDYNALDL